MRDTIAKIRPNDLDLHFYGKKFEIVIFQKLAQHVKLLLAPGVFSNILVF